MACSVQYSLAEDEIFVPLGMQETLDERMARLRKGISRLESLLAHDPHNDRYMALLGVGEYFLSKDGGCPAERVVKTLEMALEMNSSNILANLYMAYQLFDAGQYRFAKERIELVLGGLSAALQRWQIVKLEELQLSCSLRLNAKEVSGDQIVGFIEKWNRVSEGERVDLRELLDALGLRSSAM